MSAELYAGGAGAVSLEGETHHRVTLQLAHAGPVRWAWGGQAFENNAVARPIVTLTPAGTPQEWAWDGSFESFHLLLPERLIRDVGGSTFGGAVLRPSVGEADPTLEPLLRLLAGEAGNEAGDNAAGASDSLVIEQLCRAVTAGLLRRHGVVPPPVPRETPATPMPSVMRRRVESYVLDRLGEKLTAEEVAAEAGLSVRHFSRRFRATFGIPLRRYVLLARVQRARDLIARRPDLTRAAVAAECGFSDEAHLSRSMRLSR